MPDASPCKRGDPHRARRRWPARPRSGTYVQGLGEEGRPRAVRGDADAAVRLRRRSGETACSLTGWRGPSAARAVAPPGTLATPAPPRGRSGPETPASPVAARGGSPSGSAGRRAPASQYPTGGFSGGKFSSPPERSDCLPGDGCAGRTGGWWRCWRGPATPGPGRYRRRARARGSPPWPAANARRSPAPPR